jgi:hypothetical protein
MFEHDANDAVEIPAFVFVNEKSKSGEYYVVVNKNMQKMLKFKTFVVEGKMCKKSLATNFKGNFCSPKKDMRKKTLESIRNVFLRCLIIMPNEETLI